MIDVTVFLTPSLRSAYARSGYEFASYVLVYKKEQQPHLYDTRTATESTVVVVLTAATPVIITLMYYSEDLDRFFKGFYLGFRVE